MTEIGSERALRVLAAESRAGLERLDLLVRRGRGGIAAGIRQAAAEIVDAVRGGGDGFLLEAVRRFDGFDASSVGELRFATARERRRPPRENISAFGCRE